MMNRVLLSVLCCMVALNLQAQLSTKELPYGLKKGIQVREQNATILAVPDMERVEKEDVINDEKSGTVRFSYPVWVNYTLENSGVWQQLDDGSKIWRLKVNMPGALSTNTYYDKFWLPEGGKFFVYSEETEQSIGAITSEFIGGSKDEPIKFATALIYGENVIFEYHQPASIKELPIISISNINYGYRYVDNPYKNKLRALGDAQSCHIDINCPKGDSWQTEKSAVTKVMVKLPNGQSAWCSGALINNTNNDHKPYVLTADHCLCGLDVEGNNDVSQWIFYWDYERGCSTGSPTERSTTGAILRANNSISDFALLELTTDPRSINNFIPYYLGWNISGNVTVYEGAGIHHPRGDVKKISLFSWVSNNFNSFPYQDNNGNTKTISPNTHWAAVIYEGDGFIENGSSGSPLLDDNGRVIGQLHGGGTKTNDGVERGCNIFDYYNGHWNWFYGRFDVSWKGSITNTPTTNNKRKLQPWLDPNNTAISNGGTWAGISTGFYDNVIIQSPEPGRTWLLGNNLPPNTSIITPCSTSNFHAKFMTGSTPATHPVTFDWSIVLYRSNGTEYVYAQQSGVTPNTYNFNSSGYNDGCLWQPAIGSLPAYEWLRDPDGIILGKVKVIVHINDGDTKYDEIGIGVVPVKNIHNVTYNSNTTVNACSDINLKNIQIQGTPTVIFNMNGHNITIDNSFQMPVGATFTVNP